MRTLHKIFRMLIVVSTACLLGFGPAAAGPPNSAAKACQNGAYVSTWVKSDGSPFVNTGDCVSYLHNGGTLVPVFIEVLSIGRIPDSNLALSQVTASGLMPGQAFAVRGELIGGGIATPNGASVDAEGEIDGFQGGYGCDTFTRLYTAETFTGVDLLDAYGNPIGDSMTPEC